MANSLGKCPYCNCLIDESCEKCPDCGKILMLCDGGENPPEPPKPEESEHAPSGGTNQQNETSSPQPPPPPPPPQAPYGGGPVTPPPGEKISSGLKVVLIILSIIVWPVGVILGAIWMSNPDPEYKEFGKILLIIGIVAFILWCPCCCLSGWFHRTGGYYGFPHHWR